ncbi:hypothetical protein M3Y98_00149900 [Aphelenchoides besseyi]|nr:hypothetical protein M3Y98_00149900 [Aphelenchoides besseyi]
MATAKTHMVTKHIFEWNSDEQVFDDEWGKHAVEFEKNKLYFEAIDKETLAWGEIIFARKQGDVGLMIYTKTTNQRRRTNTGVHVQIRVPAPQMSSKRKRVETSEYSSDDEDVKRRYNSNYVKPTQTRDDRYQQRYGALEQTEEPKRPKLAVVLKETLDLSIGGEVTTNSDHGFKEEPVVGCSGWCSLDAQGSRQTREISIKSEHDQPEASASSQHEYDEVESGRQERPNVSQLSDTLNSRNSNSREASVEIDEETAAFNEEFAHEDEDEEEDDNDHVALIDIEVAKSRSNCELFVGRYGEMYSEFVGCPWFFSYAERLARYISQLVGTFPDDLRDSIFHFVTIQTSKRVDDVDSLQRQLLKRVFYRLMWKWNSETAHKFEVKHATQESWDREEVALVETDPSLQT